MSHGGTCVTDDLTLLEARQDIHKLIAQQAPLEKTLGGDCFLWDGHCSPALRWPSCASTRHSAPPLSLFPSQRFLQRYFERLQSVPASPEVASFGAVARLRRLAITEDIRVDPRWESFRSAALIALAIVRNRDSRRHRMLAEWHRSLFVNHPDELTSLI